MRLAYRELRAIGLIALLLWGVWATPAVSTDDAGYLSTTQTLAIGSGALGAFGIGHAVSRIEEGEKSLWTRPWGIDMTFTRWLGGEMKPGQMNFLDNEVGSFLTVAGASALILSADLAYPVNTKGKDALHTQFVFVAGALTNKGATDFLKGIFARPRPLTTLAPEMAIADRPDNYGYRYRSFVSGHASSAFYSMTFLNLKIRDTMRREMSADDYRDWRWVPSVVSYAWATFVAYSRIEAYRHYITDVTAGALLGIGVATLFFSLTDDIQKEPEAVYAPPATLLRVSFAF
ncbi:phosphatase PAP2 family protein [candidate division GN15 bacterium]|nr:phosphatase PAP2 family protein [candidate division GN15 bacterium]